MSNPLLLTLEVTGVSMVLQLLVGVPAGLLLARRKNTAMYVLDFIVTLPMIFPPVALGFFLLLVLGKNGIVGETVLLVLHGKIVFTFWGVLIATFIVGVPFMVKSVQSSRMQLDGGFIEAAAILGKNRFEILMDITLPHCKNGILAGLFLSFGRSLGEVGISLMLGGNIIGRTETLSLAIYNAVFEGDFKRAAALSIVISIIAFVAWVGLTFLNRGNRIPLQRNYQ